ncbi:MAG: dihydrofolate reductase [Desulfobulbaceae bacterium]|nr:dihydrofolate reductase [Desulfobulbaceae bacterium]
MEIIIIVAMAANRTIGQNNDIPWHIPGEQQRFKKITMGHTLVMGRRTYQSIGRPLPGRKTVIITRNNDYHEPGCTVVHSLNDALQLCQSDEKVFIAGGGDIFAQTMHLADAIYLTTLHREVTGDIFFPEFSKEDFIKEKEEVVDNEEEPYTFTIYQRRK